MSARKLSDADRKAILEEYRQPGETTLTIANRYGVSNSTISRMLKSSLSPKEYEALIGQKRATRTHNPPARTSAKKEPVEPSTSSETPKTLEKSEKPKKLKKVEKIDPTTPSGSFASDSQGRRRRKRSSASENEDGEKVSEEISSPPQLKASVEERNEVVVREKTPPILKRDRKKEEAALEQEDFALSEGLEDFEADDDFDDLTGDEVDDQPLPKKVKTLGSSPVQVLPFAGANLPKTCYLVVDRAAELITRPLKDFADLGQIPAREVSEKTLPIFDNHRVARRFANRSQRVTKIPDSRMLQKVSSYLQAKGITRILIDGQVYSL